MLGLGLGLKFDKRLLNKQYYLEFDGTNWVDLTSVLAIKYNSENTIVVWYKLGFTPDSSSSKKFFLANNDTNYYHYIGYDNLQLLSETDTNGEYGIIENNPPIDETSWHCLCLSVDASGNTKWYIDGVYKDTRTVTTDTTLNRIGYALTLGYVGGITKIAKYVKVLSQSEVSQIYANGNPKNSKPELISDIVHYWDFHEGKGLTLADTVGSNNGTLAGGAVLPIWRKL